MQSLRQRNRHAAMKLTQRTALDMFERQGFDAVTVNEIAAEVGMAASTVFRHFETKEAIVLWDEHDDGLDDALERELNHQPPFAAIRTAFVQELGGRYDDDLDFQLRRVRYIYQTPQLHAAAVESTFSDIAELTAALELALSKKNRASAGVMAGAAIAALDVAFDRWQAAGAKTSLGVLIDEAFNALANLERLK